MARPGFGRRLRDFLASDELDATICIFLDRNAAAVIARSDLAEQKSDSAPVEGEFSLRSYDLWKDYLSEIEGFMEELRRDEGLSEVDFKQAVEDAAEKDPMLVRFMIASWEFPQFVDLCRDYVISKESGEGGDAGGADDDEAAAESKDRDDGEEDAEEEKEDAKVCVLRVFKNCALLVT